MSADAECVEMAIRMNECQGSIPKIHDICYEICSRTLIARTFQLSFPFWEEAMYKCLLGTPRAGFVCATKFPFFLGRDSLALKIVL